MMGKSKGPMEGVLTCYLIGTVKEMRRNLTEVFADGGYDSFQVHADISYHLKARPYIEPPNTAIVQEEGTEPTHQSLGKPDVEIQGIGP